jgi:hypothetical protein
VNEIKTRADDGVLGWWIWMLDAAKVSMSDDFPRYEKLWTWIYERIIKRDRELRAESASNARLRGAMDADDERLRVHGERVGLFFDCDTAEHMADEIVALRADNEALKQKSAEILAALSKRDVEATEAQMEVKRLREDLRRARNSAGLSGVKDSE